MPSYKWAVQDYAGEDFMLSHPADVRRESGSVYTPLEIVDLMIDEAIGNIEPECIVDCGCGSGRFAVAAARAFPNAKVYAVDSSALACKMCGEYAADNGLSDRIEVVNLDFMDFAPPADRGRTLWIGNPPYIRHHSIDKGSKSRFKELGRKFGLPASALSGLHIHFLAHVRELWLEGDFAVFITSAEWLDVNYGAFVREMLTSQLPVKRIQIYDRKTQVFDGTDATAVVFSFSEKGTEFVSAGMSDAPTKEVSIEALRSTDKWSALLERPESAAQNLGLVPLGSIVSVHRGVVTGNNRFWVRKPEDLGDIPMELTIPIVSRAHEITGDCVAQKHPEQLKRLIVLPCNIDELSDPLRNAAQRILDDGSASAVDKGYVARSRRAWWSVKPPKAPAIMMTYMSRQNPTFVRNIENLPMLNTIHGLYPKERLSNRALMNLIEYLNNNVSLQHGRTYCGGLVKFEPREVEAILVPPLETLEVM